METSILVKLKALACKFNTSKTPLRVFFTFLKFYRWYQIVQSISNISFRSKIYHCIFYATLLSITCSVFAVCRMMSQLSFPRDGLTTYFLIVVCLFLSKVARAVDLKLAFMDLFFLKFDSTNKVKQNLMPELGKALLFPRNQGICLENWKLWWVPTTIQLSIFWWTFAQVSYLTMSANSGFCGCEEMRPFLIFANHTRSKQNKKIANNL